MNLTANGWIHVNNGANPSDVIAASATGKSLSAIFGCIVEPPPSCGMPQSMHW